MEQFFFVFKLKTQTEERNFSGKFCAIQRMYFKELHKLQFFFVHPLKNNLRTTRNFKVCSILVLVSPEKSSRKYFRRINFLQMIQWCAVVKWWNSLFYTWNSYLQSFLLANSIPMKLELDIFFVIWIFFTAIFFSFFK